MQSLALVDVEAIVRLLALAGDPTNERPLAESKRLLLQGVADLIQADVWLWSTVARDNKIEGNVAALNLIDGGWRDNAERLAFIRYATEQETALPGHEQITQLARLGRHFTLRREEIYDPEVWHAIEPAFHATGLRDFISSVYPLDDNHFSGIGYYRRSPNPPFTDREKTIVHVVFQQVDWLHRSGAGAPVGTTVLRLTGRERQVLLHLLTGDTRKEIAEKLELSEHTVGDYTKSIYRRLQVNSRGELLSQFISGGLPRNLAPTDHKP